MKSESPKHVFRMAKDVFWAFLWLYPTRLLRAGRSRNLPGSVLEAPENGHQPPSHGLQLDRICSFNALRNLGLGACGPC